MSFLRRLYRLLKIAAVFAYSIVEVVIQRPKSRAARAAWLSRIGNRLCQAVDITYDTIGNVPVDGAVISNHLSYVDIVIHASLRPASSSPRPSSARRPSLAGSA